MPSVHRPTAGNLIPADHKGITMSASFSGTLSTDGGKATLEREPNIGGWSVRRGSVAVSGELESGQSLRMKETDGVANLSITFDSGTLKRFVNTGPDGSGGTEVESYTSPASVTLSAQAEAVRYEA